MTTMKQGIRIFFGDGVIDACRHSERGAQAQQQHKDGVFGPDSGRECFPVFHSICRYQPLYGALKKVL